MKLGSIRASRSLAASTLGRRSPLCFVSRTRPYTSPSLQSQLNHLKVRFWDDSVQYVEHMQLYVSIHHIDLVYARIAQTTVGNCIGLIRESKNWLRISGNPLVLRDIAQALRSLHSELTLNSPWLLRHIQACTAQQDGSLNMRMQLIELGGANDVEKSGCAKLVATVDPGLRLEAVKSFFAALDIPCKLFK